MSTHGRNKTSGLIKKQIRTVQEGTRFLLMQSGLQVAQRLKFMGLLVRFGALIFPELQFASRWKMEC